MSDNFYKYVIVGGGLAGASAIEGIRQEDAENSILLIAAEKQLPYHRPPLTKDLWLDKKKVEDIFVYDQAFYDDRNVDLLLGLSVSSINPNTKMVSVTGEKSYAYEKLLLATGGFPRLLSIPGGDEAGLYYYRYLKDYLRMKPEAQAGKNVVIIGGGFIGSEIAAALSSNGLAVTMIFPDSYICSRIFPDYLGGAIQDYYQGRGIKILKGDKPKSIARQGDKFIVITERNGRVESGIVIVGIGIKPDIRLAEEAGLKTDDGITVNEYLQTSNPDIYAAGDNAKVFYKGLGKTTRMEHWDNAVKQGKQAGKNMAGGAQPFTSLPYFFSDLFEFGYEAVGEIDSGLETFADWEEENRKGVIYYLKDDRIRGVMMCNVWKKVSAARKLILEGKKMAKDDLRGLIR